VKEKFMKGFVIAEISSYERKVHERLCDSRNSIVRKEKFVKGLRDSRRLRESLKSHRQRDSHRKA
jgi:hypothetical protein